MSILLGLDVGTGGARAVAMDERGNVVAEASASYPLHSPRPGWSEQDPADWWRGAKEVLGRVAAEVMWRRVSLRLPPSGRAMCPPGAPKAGAPGISPDR